MRRKYTAAWSSLLAAGLALETQALRRKDPTPDPASASGHVWWLLGEPYSPRWWAGAAFWGWLTAHFFYRRWPGPSRG